MIYKTLSICFIALGILPLLGIPVAAQENTAESVRETVGERVRDAQENLRSTIESNKCSIGEQIVTRKIDQFIRIDGELSATLDSVEEIVDEIIDIQSNFNTETLLSNLYSEYNLTRDELDQASDAVIDSLNQIVNGACSSDTEAFRSSIENAKTTYREYKDIQKSILTQVKDIYNLLS